MNNKKDVVISAVTNYNWDQIKYWANSLDRSGFIGDKIVICYNVDYSLVEELAKRNYIVHAFNDDKINKRFTYNKPGFNIVVERFFHYWYFLNNYKDQYRYVIATDIKDVIFQKNPSTYLDRIGFNVDILPSSECIKYKDEEWGRNNMINSFGEILYYKMKDKVIYNAGVMAGEFGTMVDLFLNISLICNGMNPHVSGGGGPDQAAYNILLDTIYKNIHCFDPEQWAAQLGTTGSHIYEKYKDYLVDDVPVVKDGNVYDRDGILFTIVHQYDRIEELKNMIHKKYQ